MPPRTQTPLPGPQLIPVLILLLVLMSVPFVVVLFVVAELLPNDGWVNEDAVAAVVNVRADKSFMVKISVFVSGIEVIETHQDDLCWIYVGWEEDKYMKKR